MRKDNLKILLAVCVLMITFSLTAEADTHYVYPGQSIRAAINAASNGDWIEVAPGTYTEAIDFLGKAVRLYSSGGASVTIINGNGAYHVVQCVLGEDANTILEGFTITGGNANGPEWLDRHGGGMLNGGSSPTVIGCVFCGNYTGDGSNSLLEGGPGGDGGGGAGMCNSTASPTLTECTFSQNVTGKGGQGAVEFTVDGSNGGNGGNGAGMYNENSSPTLTKCTFRDNATGNGGNGGTSVYEDGGNGGNSGSGSGMYNDNSSPTLTECTFRENTTGNGGRGAFSLMGRSGNGGKSGSGAGISNTAGSSPVVSGCNFKKNRTGNGGKSDGSGGMESLLPYGHAQNGGDGGSSGSGAGMSNTGGSSPTVRDCTFTENRCGNGGNGGIGGSLYALPLRETTLYAGDGGNGGDGGQGAGMYNNSSSPIVTECTFTGNQCGSGGPGGQGGYTPTRKYPFIDISELLNFRIVIIYCESYPGDGGMGGIGGDGGGICSRDSSPAVTDCTFIANKSGNGGNGGAGGVPLLQPKQKATGGSGGNGGDGAGICYLDCSVSDVNDCAFSDNQAGVGGLAGIGTFLWVIKWQSTGSPGSGGDGGGIGVHQSLPIVTNCTFAGNSAWYGGGIYNDSNSTSDSPTVTNCTFTKNVGKTDGGGLYNENGNPTLTNCILWDDVPGEIGGSANVTYCDVEGGYAGTGNIDASPAFADDAWRLPLGSICIDAGSNSAPNLPARDFDGWPRIMGTTVDMGAFEYTADLRIRNATTDILYATMQGAIDDANEGDEISVLPGTYYSPVDFKGKAVRLYSTGGPQYTTINGGGAYHVVQCVSGEGPGTILEGFKITGGDANGSSAPDNCGGGMLNSGSSPTVLNCVFMFNAATGDGGGMFNESCSPTIINCTFYVNTATGGGGGMDNENSSPTVINCIFTGNTTSGGGGGLRNADSSHPTVTSCTFESNTASTHGGGMVNVLSSSPTLTGCIFEDNTASGLGGGIINSVGCSPLIVNCIFGSNQAENGGGMFNNDNSNPIVTNCDFSGNSATTLGGGMHNNKYSYPIVTNCIFWGDTPQEIYNSLSTPFVTYCDVQGGYAGTGNINADPNFPGSIDWWHPERSWYLSTSASPCVDAGDSNAPYLPGTDMGGQPRVIDGDVDGNSAVDMGAYELQPCIRNITRNRWYQLIQHSVDDACDYDRIEVNPGTYYENVDFCNAPDNFALTSIDPNDPDVVEQTIINAKFGGDVIKFWSQGSSCVLAGFTLSGNFLAGSPGYGISCQMGLSTSPTIRNCVITDTLGVDLCCYGSPVISGCTIRDNIGGLTVCDAVVEDCTIANNYYVTGYGSTFSFGVHILVADIHQGDTTLARCVISGNRSDGGGVCCDANTWIEDCVISDNCGLNGGIWAADACPATKISGCMISNNKGGGITGWAGPIENCIITGNDRQDPNAQLMLGGGICYGMGPITNCVIQGNKAQFGGGLFGCNGPIVNCVIAANRGQCGGGLSDCDGAISNCIIVGNVAWGDSLPDEGLGGGLYDCNAVIANCIIRQNWAQTAGDQLYSSSEPNYSCIEGWSGGGTGNITSDPCFVSAGYWADANDPNTVVAPDDPNTVWVDGFYRLARNSPCIDAGDNGSVPGVITTDLSGLPRFIDTCTADTGSGTAPLVDMGAYEFLPADIDGSGSVNMRDYSVLAAIWLQTSCEFCYGADFTCDGNVDWYDLQDMTNWWLAGI